MGLIDRMIFADGGNATPPVAVPNERIEALDWELEQDIIRHRQEQIEELREIIQQAQDNIDIISEYFRQQISPEDMLYLCQQSAANDMTLSEYIHQI